MGKALTLLAVALTAASVAAAFAMPSAAGRRQVPISHRPAAVLAALEAAHLGTRPKRAHRPKRHAAPRLPSVSLVTNITLRHLHIDCGRASPLHLPTT